MVKKVINAENYTMLKFLYAVLDSKNCFRFVTRVTRINQAGNGSAGKCHMSSIVPINMTSILTHRKCRKVQVSSVQVQRGGL